jgi:hypothetical protein
MHMLFLAIILLLCFLLACRFMPFTALTVLILAVLYLAGVIPPSDGFFSLAVWAFVCAIIGDAIVHIARMAGFGNRDDIRITR